MPNYEIIYLLSPKISEKEAKEKIEAGNSIMKELGGKVAKEDYWGLKELAYPIKHHKQGYYHVTWFELDRDQVLELSQKLKSINKILRFLITEASPEKPAPTRKKKVEKEEEPKTLKAKPLERKKVVTAQEKKTIKKEEKPKGDKVQKAKKSELKDLDDKLDEILKEEVL